jgi:hypothetical protein
MIFNDRMPQLPEGFVACPSREDFSKRGEAHHEIDTGHSVRAVSNFQEPLSIRNSGGDRLLNEDVFTSFHRCSGDRGMKIWRRRDRDEIDLFIQKQLLPMVVNTQVLR